MSYDLILIPNYTKSGSIALAEQLIRHGKTFDPPRVLEVFDVDYRYAVFFNAPEFAESEKNIMSFIYHYSNVIFRPGSTAVICNFKPDFLLEIIHGVQLTNADAKIILLVGVEVSLLDTDCPNLEMFFCNGAVPKLSILDALFPPE